MFKKRKLEVKMVKDGQTEYQPNSLDRLDIEMLSREIAQDVAATYICYKGFKTLCSMLEHIVVTKVK